MPPSSKPNKKVSSAGVLDLSELAEAPPKVKLPGGGLYDMANPAELGILDQQKCLSRYRRAQDLMARPDPTDDDLHEMFELLLDVAQIVVPDADRDTLGKLSLPRIERLIEVFFVASSAKTSTTTAEEATRPRSTSDT